MRSVAVFDLKLFTASELKHILGYPDIQQILSSCLITQDLIRMERKHSQQLCEICKDIDFKQYFQREIGAHVYEDSLVGASKDALRLGLFKDIVEKSSSCPFCHLVASAICRRRTSWTFSPEQQVAANSKQKNEMECWIYSYSYASHDPEKAEAETANRIGVATRICEGFFSSPEDHAGDIQLLADDAWQIGKSRLFHGRVVNAANLDLKLARGWLRCCENEHGELCAVPRFMRNDPNVEPHSLMVVDVRHLCICYLPSGSRYICLSYCWPPAKPFTLTQATLSQLFHERSLEPRMHELPYTIRDAIQCVSDLGETYLWVDSLCIIQDNEDEKRHQISQMDRIYTFAFLTLVSASSLTEYNNNPRCGLPRYRKDTRGAQQVIDKVGNLHLAVPFDTLNRCLESSRWLTRTWTYEERILSRRLIYFTETQVYFQCSCSVFCEDGVGENNPVCARIYPASNLWNLDSPYASQDSNSDFGSLQLKRTEYADSEEAIQEYSNHIGAYTMRSMSDNSDILNAFKGIEAVMKRSMNTRFWYGLPESHLDSSILWTLTGTHKRRSVRIKGFTNPCFPSWTWAGWDSPVELGSYFFITGLRREIHWYLVNRKGEMIRMATENTVAELEFTEYDGRNVGPQFQLSDHVLAAEKPRLEVDTDDENWRYPEYLACWTTLAVFNLIGGVAPLGDHGMVWENGVHLAISNSNEKWVGSIMMDQEWVMGHLPRPRFEFILLSRSKGIFDLLPSPQPKYYDEETFIKRPWCMLNVMLIEREDDVARRLGVGFIHDVAWLEANPISIFIKLE